MITSVFVALFSTSLENIFLQHLLFACFWHPFDYVFACSLASKERRNSRCLWKIFALSEMLTTFWRHLCTHFANLVASFLIRQKWEWGRQNSFPQMKVHTPTKIAKKSTWWSEYLLLSDFCVFRVFGVFLWRPNNEFFICWLHPLCCGSLEAWKRYPGLMLCYKGSCKEICWSITLFGDAKYFYKIAKRQFKSVFSLFNFKQTQLAFPKNICKSDLLIFFVFCLQNLCQL